MKNIKNKRIIFGAIIVIVLVIAFTYIDKSSSTEESADNGPSFGSATTTFLTEATSTPIVTTSSTSNPGQIFAYYLNIATTTFSQNQPINMTLFVYNLSKVPETMTFPTGCQGTYTIAGFDMMKHITCIPSSTSFTIKPESVRQVAIAHYPGVFKIPTGQHDLYTGIVGYGGITTSVTITP